MLQKGVGCTTTVVIAGTVALLIVLNGTVPER
jgi:hypothetical protein